MLVQEIFETKPRKTIREFSPGEVFKYDGEWFMVIQVDFDRVTNWDEFCADNTHNPLNMDCNECELTPCICLETNTFCFLGDHWYANDYGTAETRITIKSRP